MEHEDAGEGGGAGGYGEGRAVGTLEDERWVLGGVLWIRG